jgi:hypothetical protein
MQGIGAGADVLNSFPFRNQQWNAHELSLNSINMHESYGPLF